MPCTGVEAWRYFCKSKHQESYKKLNENRNKEETRKVNEADHINGKLCYDQKYPSDELQKGTRGEQSSAYTIII